MSYIWDEKCQISPSLICLNMLCLEEQIHQLEQAGIHMLHIDILDGHFSPSMPLGFETVKQLRQVTALPFECHVMANPPDYFINELLEIGVEQIVFQIETACHIDGLINTIHHAGIRAGLALKPSTPLTELEYILEKCDAVLLMQINPGYASHQGESRIGYVDRKLRHLRSMIDSRSLDTKIILDGRVSLENITEYGKDLVDIFVGGTTCISSKDIPQSAGKILELRKKLLEEL